MQVHVLTVMNLDGEPEDSIAHVSVHSSPEKARTFLAAYCRGEWERQGHEGPLSRDDEESIKRYFDYWDSEMGWDISECELDPDPVSADQSPEFFSEN
jgi:hypothetical protein